MLASLVPIHVSKSIWEGQIRLRSAFSHDVAQGYLPILTWNEFRHRLLLLKQLIHESPSLTGTSVRLVE